MTITRERIIATLRDHLAPDPRVLAAWLEGADATGFVDEFSDIDFCCSVEPGALDAAVARAQAALEGLGRLDLVDSSSRGEDFHYAVFHLEGTSPYLLIDFNGYVGRGSIFTEGDTIEKPQVLFDRAGVVRFIQPQPDDPGARLLALENTARQDARIEKYIRRGDFLEAFGYYHRWLLTPLIEALRMRYTPLHPDYYIVHISRHLPAGVLRRLERLFQVSSLADLEVKLSDARAFFDETDAFLRATGHEPSAQH